MRQKSYDRQASVNYAKKWAYARNPQYYDFERIGGDCTNFASQCIFEGSKTMNYNLNGWYYKNANNRAPSWTGVEYLYKFLVNNKHIGPYGKNSDISEIEEGDIAQLSFNNNVFSHSLIIVKILNKNLDNILVATHTYDSLNRPISTYNFQQIRFIHIENIRIF